MKKTLSIGRKPTQGSQLRTHQSRAGALEDHLAALLGIQPRSPSELPVARMKSKDKTHNPDQLDIVLIRRNPLPLENEYDVAITEPNGAALSQWLAAGVGDRFPEKFRSAAEVDACFVAMQEAQASNRRSDKLRKRYYRQKDEVDIAEHEAGASDYDRARLSQIAQTTHVEMEVANAIEASERYFRLDHIDRTGVCVTPAGRGKLYQLKLLSAWDTVYADQRIAGILPAKTGTQLRTISDPFCDDLKIIAECFINHDCTTLAHVNLWLRELAESLLECNAF